MHYPTSKQIQLTGWWWSYHYIAIVDLAKAEGLQNISDEELKRVFKNWPYSQFDPIKNFKRLISAGMITE